ncbi:uncharacterized protein LOC105189303 isoform X2 [Harpegnathos saltator]|uniref:uncharacterized protein LOC105189303 isoform X2 n=1 Tax=Harpegnathos saltator TaxID=610380 RepID=UPI00058F7D9C|nr:uncharacterized protein LOC105189303 isoform X2 [Harpegnathos saltator]
MEFDQNTVLDSVFVLVPIQLILVTCVTIFYRLKIRWPVKVNCWFCNQNTKVWRQNLTWWLCPSCQQFNGFSKNGDYAYDIPEQYATFDKCTRYCSLPKQNNAANVPKNNLCIDCNKRESLKLAELSNFEPRDENLYDTELKVFKEYLEKKYPLCGSCRSIVWDVLNKQSLWLMRYKMLFFRQKPINAIINKAKKLDTVFRFITVVLSSIISYNHEVIWLPFGGLFFHLCAYCTNSMKRKNSDMLLIILWCCMTILILIKNLTTLQNIWLTAEHITQYYMIAVCALLISFLNIKPSSYNYTLTTSVSFKKLKLHTRNTTASSQVAYDNRNKNDNVLNQTNSSIELSSSAGELFTTEIKSHLAVPKQKSYATTTSIHNDSYLSSITQCKNDSPYSFCLDNNVSALSALSLSEDSSRYSARTPPIFERRIYGMSTCDLFKRSSVASGRRCILSPPKLQSVTQTSWVAGGYWQEGMVSGVPTLSRSSSQSSGFGSAGSSNFAPSREPSVHEFDRCSVVSDATQSCYTPRGNIANPARFFTSSTAPRAQSRCTMYDTTTTRMRNCSQSQLLAVRACNNVMAADNQEHVAAVVGNGGRNDSIPMCPSHTTVVTSPGSSANERSKRDSYSTCHANT